MGIPFSRLKRIIDGVLAAAGEQPLPIPVAPIKQAIIGTGLVQSIDIITIPNCGKNLIGEYRLIHIPKGLPYSGEYESHARIKVAGNLNLCWTRMVVAKELCHCILDYDASRVKSAADAVTLGRALILKDELKAAMSGSLPFFNDRFAINAALELLCPIKQRRQFFDAYAKREISEMGLAEMFRVPRDYIQNVFDAEYTDIMEEMIGKG